MGVSRLVSGLNLASCVLFLGLAGLTAPIWATDQTMVNSDTTTDAAATSSATAPVASAAPAGTAAQAEGLAEVVVTATRREEALEKVPVSVEAITDVQMEVAGVREFDDIVRQTPELNINPSYGRGNDVAIRGIASNAGASTTGVYLDDAPIQVINHYLSNGEIFPTVFDLQRVEVLRGPQGTLFGAGSEGGTVRFIQEQPSLTAYSGYARAEGASLDVGTGHSANYEVGLSYGGPIVDNVLGFRVSAYYRQDGGYIDYGPWLSATVNNRRGEGLAAAATMVPNDSALNDNVNWSDIKAFHAALRWQPTQSLTITPSIFYQRQDYGFPSDNFYLAGSNPGAGFFYVPEYFPGAPGSNVNCSPAALAAADATGCPVTGPLTRLRLPTSYNADNQLSVSAFNIQWNINESMTFISTTAFVYTGLTSNIDTTSYYAVNAIDQAIQPFPLPGEFSPTFSWTSSKALTQEFRLSGTSKWVNWLVGAFFSRDDDEEFEYEENNDWSGSNYFFEQYIPPGGPPFGPGYSSQQDAWGYPLMNDSGTYYGDSRTDDTQIAGFTQVDIHLTPIFTLTAGIRVAHDRLKFSLYSPGDENNENAPFGSPCPPGYDVPLGSGNCPYGSGYWAPQFPGGIQSTTARPVTPKFALNAQLTNDNLLYVSATKGFRIGGAQLPNPADCNGDLAALGYVINGKPYTPPTYAPDFVWSYELGSKNRTLDGKLTVDGSIYYIKWTDIQTSIDLPTCGYDITTNTGTATVKGFDFDAQYAPIPGLQLRTDVGYVHTSLDNGLYEPDGSAVYTRGSAVPGSGAPWNVLFSGRYEIPVNDQIHGYFYLDDRWNSQWPRTGRNDPGTFDFLPYWLPNQAYNTANLRLGAIRGGWDVSFFMNNVGNARPLFYNANSSLHYIWSATTITPRTTGVTAAYRF